MLEVVSVSLGSPSRDHEAEVLLCGRRFLVRRIGTGGDVATAARLVRALDGRVAAIGLGGINRALEFGGRRYPLPQGAHLAAQAETTPVADGSRWKAVVEPAAVAVLARRGLPLAGRTAVVSSVLDREPLARALQGQGCRVLAGDAFYALGLPLFFPSLGTFSLAARLTVPLLRRVPIQRLYPLGPRQERVVAAPPRLFRGVDLLAGDFHLLRRRLPADLAGKTVIASTFAPADLDLLRRRGLTAVAALAPPVAGRGFGANVWEAMVAAAHGRPPERVPAAAFLAFWREAGGPWLEMLNWGHEA